MHKRIFDLHNRTNWPINIEMCTDLFDSFDCIRMYHCTNLEDPFIIKKEGLKLPEKEILLERALNLFSKFRSKEAIREAYDMNLTKFGEPNSIWLGIDDRFLIEQCGHYSLYGSEFISGVGTTLEIDKLCYRNPYGNPLLITVDIPINLSTIQYITDMPSLNGIIKILQMSKSDDERHNISFSIKRNIKPKYITNIKRLEAKSIPDPYFQFKRFDFDER